MDTQKMREQSAKMLEEHGASINPIIMGMVTSAYDQKAQTTLDAKRANIRTMCKCVKEKTITSTQGELLWTLLIRGQAGFLTEFVWRGSITQRQLWQQLYEESIKLEGDLQIMRAEMILQFAHVTEYNDFNVDEIWKSK